MFEPIKEIKDVSNRYQKNDKSIEQLQDKIIEILQQRCNINPALTLEETDDSILINCNNVDTFFTVSGIADKVKVIEKSENYAKFEYLDQQYILNINNRCCTLYPLYPVETISINFKIV